MSVTDDIMKFDMTTNPYIVQLPPTVHTTQKTFTIDEILIETSSQTVPNFLKIHHEGASFYGPGLKRVTEIEAIAKSNIWGNLVQFYKPFDMSKEQVKIGINNTITLVMTDDKDVPLDMSQYTVAHIVLHTYNYNNNK